MSRRRATSPGWILTLLVCLLGVLVSGCGTGSTGGATKAEPSSSSTPTPGVLVIKGEPRDGTKDTPAGHVPARTKATSATPSKLRTIEGEWPEPERNADGTIAEADDPLATGSLQAQPLPIEDDPDTTAAIDAWSRGLQSVPDTTWTSWLANGNANRWTSQIPDAVDAAVVGVGVERCGGARTMASGVVLDDETVVTTVHVVESAGRRPRIYPAGSTVGLPAMIRYLDVDDDIAVLKVPGLKATALTAAPVGGKGVIGGYAYGAPVFSRGGGGSMRRVPVLVEATESVIDVEQPDGFAKRITDRSVYPLVGAIDTGFSGGPVMATKDPTLTSGLAFHGIVRARVPYRSQSGGIVVPARLVRVALAAAAKLPTWFEIAPGGCPQWHR